MSACLKTLLPFFCPLCLFAQQLTFAPVFRNYTTDQGLPNNWIFGILQDRQGYLWVSTQKGVCRFDGYAFRQFPDTLYTNHTSVLSPNMMEDEAGRLWFIDFQNRVFYIENDRIIPWKRNALLIDTLRDRINDISWIIVKGRGEEVLLGAKHRGILRIADQGDWETLPRPAEACWHLFEYKNRQIVCPVESSLQTRRHPFTGNLPPLFCQNEQGAVLTDPLPCPGSRDMRLSFTGKLPEGGWVHFWLGYVYYFQSGRLQWFREYRDGEVAWVTQDRKGAVFVGTLGGGGLVMYRSFEDFRKGRIARRMLPGLSVSYIFIDREGGYWIGTQERGLFYCASFEQGRPEAPEALREGIVKSLDWDRSNTLYAGTGDARVFALDLRGAGVRDISPPRMNYLDNLHFDTLSQTLAASGAGQFGRFFYRGAWRDREVYDPGLKQQSYTGQGSYFFPGRAPGVWVSTSYGGLREIDLRANIIRNSTHWKQKKHTRYYTIRQDQTGRTWASTRQGLVEWVGDSILPAHQGYRALQQRINDIELLPDTSLVLCPRGHGVVIWKPGRPPLEINTGQGLLSAAVNNLHCAPGGVIWACSERGVNKLTPDGRGGYRVNGYTMKQGLPTNTVYDAFGIGDTLWLATDKGLFRMIEHVDTTTMPAPLLASLSVNNAWYASDRALSLPYDSANVALEFVCLHFRSKGQIAYAFRLCKSGDESPWTYTADRRVNFPNLSPGHYRFEVKAQTGSGVWSTITALDIRIRPPWWATWWVRSLGLGLMGAAAFGIYKWRVGQIKRDADTKTQMHRLEQSALQAQMNPHFIFNCLNSIQQFILNNEKVEAARFLSKFASLVRDTLNASVNGEVALEDEVRMLDNYLQLERLRFQGKFEYEIRVDDNLDVFDTVLPPIIVQPFVENAILHGLKGKESGGKIQVVFFNRDGLLCVRISDNGSGIRPNAGNQNAHHRASLGISRTQKRFALLREKYKSEKIDFEYITHSTSDGTEVLLRLPLPNVVSDSGHSN